MAEERTILRTFTEGLHGDVLKHQRRFIGYRELMASLSRHTVSAPTLGKLTEALMRAARGCGGAAGIRREVMATDMKFMLYSTGYASCEVYFTSRIETQVSGWLELILSARDGRIEAVSDFTIITNLDRLQDRLNTSAS